jgi:hypothetical protein
METIKNFNYLLGDSLKQTLRHGAKLQVAASCFSMFAYEALKKELQKVDSEEFIFTLPAFAHGQSTDNLPKEHREFFIPKLERERSLYGIEFEIQLLNKLTQRGVDREVLIGFASRSPAARMPIRHPCNRWPALRKRAGSHLFYFPLQGFTEPAGKSRAVSELEPALAA